MSALVVLDTNVMFNALHQRVTEQGGLDQAALERAWRDDGKLAFSRPTMDELALNLIRHDIHQMKGVTQFQRHEFLGEVQSKHRSQKVEPAVHFTGCEDVEDDKIAAVALTIGSVVVTRDRKLLELSGRTVKAGPLESRFFALHPQDYLKMQRMPLMHAFSALANGGPAVPAVLVPRRAPSAAASVVHKP